MAKFLDSSIFLHAYLKPKRKLKGTEKEVKEKAAAILEKIEKGEQVVTSTIHLSEAVNIVEARLGLEKVAEFLENVLTTENITIEEVRRKDYEAALALVSRFKISPNDAVACLISQKMNIGETYSSDKHFDNVPFVKRIL